MPDETRTIGGILSAQFDDWFGQLQAIAPDPEELDPEDWTGRWYDGYSPKEALEDGPDED